MNTLYILVIIVIMFFSITGTFVNNKGKDVKENRPTKLFLYIIIIILVLISGIRDLSFIKGDEYVYRTIFDNIKSNNFNFFNQKNEYGFLLINYILANLFGNSQWLIFFCSVITNVLIVTTLYKRSNYFNFSIFLYLTCGSYFTSFNIMRQFLAISIFFSYGINYIFDKKKLKYIITILLITTIHFSSIILLPMYWIINMKNKKKLYICTTLVCLIIFLAFGSFFNVLSSWGSIGNYYTDYNKNAIGVNIIRIITIVLPVVILGINYKYISCKNKDFEYLYYFSFISMIIMIFSYRYLYFSRLYDFFGIVNLILIPELIYLVKSQKSRLLVLLIVSLLYLTLGYIDQSKTLYKYATINGFEIKPLVIFK